MADILNAITLQQLFRRIRILPIIIIIIIQNNFPRTSVTTIHLLIDELYKVPAFGRLPSHHNRPSRAFHTEPQPAEIHHRAKYASKHLYKFPPLTSTGCLFKDGPPIKIPPHHEVPE